MRAGNPSITARSTAAQRLRLERTRPSTPGGDVEAERRLSRDVAGKMTVVGGWPSALAVRTRVIDAEVARAIGHGTAQIVLLGAGYDGRSFRFGGGTVRWFEVDRPAVLADKRRRLDALGLAATGAVAVGLDLSTDDLDAGLDAAGHDPAAPSLFVCEALLDAVTLEAAASVCANLRTRAAAGSVLTATFLVAPEPGAPARALRSATGLLRRAADEPRRNEFRPGDPEKLMVVSGWRVAHAESSGERRLDPGAHTLVLVCEPDPARGGRPADPPAGL
jgi:methyltransferase (TIGR00027 family)